ncbi:PhoPQ-activated pathogenicity protein, partial [Candidatus Acetothermia bacterium]
ASWEVGTPRPFGSGEILSIRLRSQTWRGIPWKHWLLLCTPAKLLVEDVLVLFISGDASPGDAFLGLSLAARARLRVAMLSDVPVQPLFEGLREDALIAYTFERYLEEGDPDWPLLFPMTRAALAAMEALEEVARGLWGIELRGFLVAGASKQGWTTYLAAAAAPARVLGMAPMVFDILDMPVQIAHQREFWGELSPMIRDYSQRGLTEAFERTPRGARLAWLVDPYSYRYAYTMPKLIVLGSNDPYWPVDALNFYWHGLPDPKAALVVPNSGHGLDDRTRVLDSLGAFCRLVAGGEPLPRLESSFVPGEAGLRIHLQADRPPAETRLWTAHSQNRNFRDVRWESNPLPPAGAGWEVSLTRSESGYIACFAELVFQWAGPPLHLTTPVRVLGP